MKKNILLGESDSNIRRSLNNLFTGAGYTVFEATQEEKICEFINKGPVDLVLLAISSPEFNTVNLLQKIKKINTKIKVIILSTKNDSELENQARQHGASGFLHKDSDKEIIVKSVKEILEDTTANSSKINILIVDDNERICDLLARFLTKKNFTPITALTAKEALEKVKSEKPQIALLDIKLPDADGITLLKQIKEISPKIGIIMITGVEDRAIAEKAIAAGAADYITKPIDFDYLETCVLTRARILSVTNR